LVVLLIVVVEFETEHAIADSEIQLDCSKARNDDATSYEPLASVGSKAQLLSSETQFVGLKT
jgi:hypothetical protein